MTHEHHDHTQEHTHDHGHSHTQAHSHGHTHTPDEGHSPAHEHPHPHTHDEGHAHSHAHGEAIHSHEAGDWLHAGKQGQRVIYLDCFAGASGDMLLGALLDAGLELEMLQAGLAKMDLDGYELEATPKRDHGLTGTKLHVHDTLEAYPARHLADIRQIVEGSTLSDRVKQQSMAVIERLGRAEAGVHGVPLDEVHFHEVGAVDTIVDVVGFVSALEVLEIDQVYASPIPLGSGTIQTAHGRLPVPVPATLALLASANAPTVSHPAETEIVTPTGAALLAQLAIFERPAMHVQAVGYGFGDKQFPWANGVRLWVGEMANRSQYEHDHVLQVECNLDDVTGEVLGYTMERLFDAGAYDVWFTSIHMKKNRPGTMLSLLAPEARVDDLAAILMRETSTLGVRTFPPAHRLKASRKMREVTTPWGTVRIKEKWLGGQRLAASPEYEDCARLARESGEAVAHIMDVARQLAE